MRSAAFAAAIAPRLTVVDGDAPLDDGSDGDARYWLRRLLDAERAANLLPDRIRAGNPARGVPHDPIRGVGDVVGMVDFQ